MCVCVCGINGNIASDSESVFVAHLFFNEILTCAYKVHLLYAGCTVLTT